ncbi:Sucrose synthase, glycosyl transferase, group 1 [Trichormus variabilis ATCC 29413]|uniref:Sucrose synthase n=2 Tax=Anabaena variabilis TaxID=264691 RepID=Q3M6M8_TRIV2|nr:MULTISPECIES: sucrose synthase [Nostocaceae]ABA23358.1 Sucrose synthase, glycosyl transferase, group 1 [Trichormus variabilis ATCC 29413]MBC1216923.1 sucrose synthase [Trichormus variabilis ARAD]MBC1257847.1 sucrose synthase [Trichormus variabilis V5]MBC1269578.1 sucrose synthase [Trichormus variabilis FSR]MBC1305101.1 sucrose synthase [Trichormus variabilis N2B]
MHELFHPIFANGEEKAALQQLIIALDSSGKRYFLRNEILHTFSQYCQQAQKPTYFYYSSSVGKLIQYTHEIVLAEDSTWFVVRPRIANQEVWRLTSDLAKFDSMPIDAFLDVSDRLVNAYEPNILEIDLSSFYEASPSISDPRNIGQGLAFLNRYLCSQIATDPQYWVELVYLALRGLQYDGINLMIGDAIPSGIHLAKQIHAAIKFLSDLPPEEPYEKFYIELQALGFEPGWGNTAERILETITLLDRLIDSPQPAVLEAFVARVPAVFRVVLVSIHGWVAQEDVMGRDETLGQVIYVLEQARSLENKLQQEIKLAGLEVLGIQPHIIILTRLIPHCEGTYCNLRLEKLHNTENAWILRVPFGEFNPAITNNWISKFEIWPYLETFALDAEKQLLAQFQGKPNLIVGNYSDGNLVAFLLARRLKVTHCNIAHSLEKPKNLFSNLYWQNSEEKYHFSVQFTADLITMNAADFIITSSYQEIFGTPESVGQYESYKFFTMPHLYHVVDGVDLFSPKFNMVPPGVNEQVFFPYSQTADRDPNLSQSVHDLLFHRQDSQIFGYLEQPQKPPIFAVAPITSIKNLTGLAECFGRSQELQAHSNLILLTSKLNIDETTNPEEAREIEKLHNIINQYQLQGHIRWLGLRLPNQEVGEAYRLVADYRGIYLHFARFEAFGRSILEAMISGLPTFATKFGGSLEILEDQNNGFRINPTDLEGTAEKILAFFQECDTHPEHWQEVSQWMSQRIHQKYNWQLHTSQLLALTKIYSFWNFIRPESSEARVRYMESLFHLIYKPRAEQILAKHMSCH